jgi:site-specific DNA recombinase
VLRGAVICGVCERRMQGQWSNERPYYRCRFPEEYALANKVDHPGNIYVREADLLPDLDKWLSQVLAPHRIAEIIRAMQQAQMPTPDDAVVTRAKAVLKECATKLDRYRAALEDGNGSSTSIG